MIANATPPTTLSLPVIPHLSWSQINSFRSCPRKWHFEKVEKAPRDFLPEPLAFGSAFHGALEKHCQALLEGSSLGIKDLMATFDQMMTVDKTSPPIKWGAKSSPDIARADAMRMFEAFLASNNAVPQGQIIAVEEELRGHIHSKLPEFVARVDLACLDGDTLYLIDFKTSRTKWSESKLQESAQQLYLYESLAPKLIPDVQRVVLQFLVITRQKTPQVQSFTIKDAVRKDAAPFDCFVPVYQAMQDGVNYPAPSSMFCPGCPYKSRCDAFQFCS